VDEAVDIPAVVASVAREHGGHLLSILISQLGDFQLAEDSLQDAFEAALVRWTDGLPSSPPAWLMQVAKHKALDRIRKSATAQAKSDALNHHFLTDIAVDEEPDNGAIADERLKLIFTCCHPALDRKTAIALTLRSVCGLNTEDIADAFLDSHDAMAQRLVRARHKISKAGIAYEVPDPDGWNERLTNVLTVIYLMFNEGYASSIERYLIGEFCDEAIRLCRVLDQLCPREPEVEGLLALMLLHHSRAKTRIGGDGIPRALEEQDRRQWNRAMITEGAGLVLRALRRGSPGPFQLQAAIAALHAEASSFAGTDWREIALLYDALKRFSDNPVYELNRIVAISYGEGAEQALALLEPLAFSLGSYQPYHAACADILARCGQESAAMTAYIRALSLTGSEPERRFIARKIEKLSVPASSGS
jgi:RNA polymerase sigma-70 factor, ECF subfamily